jgi:hypothetical protein
MRHRHRRLLALAVVVALPACSSAFRNAASIYIKTGVIGPSGGTIRVMPWDDAKYAGTSIVVPAGAISQQVTITISVSNEPVAQEGSQAAGLVVDFGPDLLMFAVPATVTIPVMPPVGAQLADLTIVAVETDGAVRTIAPQSMAGGLITFAASTFTRFGATYRLPGDGGSPCPPSVPSAGFCAPSGPYTLACEYGGDSFRDCVDEFVCSESDAGYAWTEPGEPTCDDQLTVCPFVFGESVGATCSDLTLECGYSEGRCGCVSCETGQDGGVGRYWSCGAWSDVGPGCPSPRPLLGDVCSVEGTTCAYAPCCGRPDLGPNMQCAGGYWRPWSEACSCTSNTCAAPDGGARTSCQADTDCGGCPFQCVGGQCALTTTCGEEPPDAGTLGGGADGGSIGGADAGNIVRACGFTDAGTNPCCPGQTCPSVISECVDTYTVCETNADCLVPGQVCARIGEFPEGLGCTFATCQSTGDCPEGQACFNSFCVIQLPCEGGCAAGSVCTPVNDLCYPLGSGAGASCQQSCGDGAELVFVQGRNVFNSCDLADAVDCECLALPACTSNSDCHSGTCDGGNCQEFCQRGGCGTTGFCAELPAVCPDGPPVCGCDLNTYSSACAAETAGISVMSTGGCAAASDAGP